MNALALCTLLLKRSPIGKERLYYLDLDSKHVSSLRLVESETSNEANIHVINLLKDNEKLDLLLLNRLKIE